MTTTPQRYTKRPVTIEAVQWDGTPEGANRIIDWTLATRSDTSASYASPQPATTLRGRVVREAVPALIAIDTLEGVMFAIAGDWIIRGVQGEFYPCKPDIFTQTYQPAAEHHGEPNADAPTDAEVRAAAEAIARCTFPDKGWWELSPWKREYNTKRARAALIAARKARS